MQNGLGDGKPQPGAGFAAVTAAAVVAVKNAGQIVGGNAGAVILHFYAAAPRGGQAAHGKPAVSTQVMAGVAQKIVQNALHHGRVGQHGAHIVGLHLQRPAVLRAHGLVALGHLAAQLGHIKFHQLGLLAAAAHAAELHHAVYKAAQAVGFVNDNAQLGVAALGAVAGQVANGFRIALDQGQRGAKIMAHIGQKLLLQLAGALHLGGHAVEILCQLAHFVLPGAAYPGRVIALGNAARSGGKLADGLGEPIAEPEAGCQTHQKHQPQNGRQKLVHHHARNADLVQVGAYQHGILLVGAQAAHHHLGGIAAGAYDLIQLALVKHGLAQLHGHIGVAVGQIAGAPAHGGAIFVYKAGIQVFGVVYILQAYIAHLHAGVGHIQRAVVHGGVHLLPEFRVEL